MPRYDGQFQSEQKSAVWSLGGQPGPVMGWSGRAPAGGPLPWLRDASGRRPRHCSAAKVHSYPRVGAVHALPRLLPSSRLPFKSPTWSGCAPSYPLRHRPPARHLALAHPPPQSLSMVTCDSAARPARPSAIERRNSSSDESLAFQTTMRGPSLRLLQTKLYLRMSPPALMHSSASVNGSWSCVAVMRSPQVKTTGQQEPLCSIDRPEPGNGALGPPRTLGARIAISRSRSPLSCVHRPGSETSGRPHPA